MKKALVIISIVISFLVISKEEEKILIPNDSIRIRIIANSNSIEDQLSKIRVKEKVEQKLYTELTNITDISSAREIIKNNIEELDNLVKKEIKSNNYMINYGNNYFPKKELFGITYDEGNYESLVIKLGKAEGENWWCVLFPPLCLLDAKTNNKNKVEYKSKVLEILKAYR